MLSITGKAKVFSLAVLNTEFYFYDFQLIIGQLHAQIEFKRSH